MPLKLLTFAFGTAGGNPQLTAKKEDRTFLVYGKNADSVYELALSVRPLKICQLTVKLSVFHVYHTWVSYMHNSYHSSFITLCHGKCSQSKANFLGYAFILFCGL